MNIRVDIQPRYRETEVCICSSECTEEVKNIYRIIKDVLNVRLTAYEGGEIRKIDGNDVIRIYSQNQKVYVSTKDGDLRLHERLYELEEKLDAVRFLRISNSEIVNMRKIVRMDISITGTIKMYLQGNVETYVSRRYVTKIKRALGIGRMRPVVPDFAAHFSNEFTAFLVQNVLIGIISESFGAGSVIMELAIETKNLRKEFGTKTAVKTTTIRMLTRLTKPTAGQPQSGRRKCLVSFQ